MNISNSDAAVKTWINDDAMLFNSITTLTTNIVSVTEGTAGAVFLGKDTSRTGVSGREIYSDPRNLPTAVASIMNHTQKKADFFPGTLTSEQIAVKFSDYIKALQMTPFFHMEKYKSHKQKMATKDYSKLIEQVSSLYEDMSQSEKDKIKTSITEIAKSVFNQSKSERWDNLFSQTAIDISNPDKPKLTVYFTILHMKHEESGKSEVSEQEYSVQTIQFSILNELIQAYADDLVEIDKTHIGPWIKSSSSTHDPEVKLCFLKD